MYADDFFNMMVGIACIRKDTQLSGNNLQTIVNVTIAPWHLWNAMTQRGYI